MKFKKTILLLLILVIMIFTGCSKSSKAEDIFESYFSQWQQGEYSAMYDLLTTDIKEQLSKEDFIKRYENIFGGIEAKNIKVEINKEEKTKKEDDRLIIPYTVKMDTLAGKIEYSHQALLTKEKENGWRLSWDEKMIFPQMEKNDQIRVETVAAKRGIIKDRNDIELASNGQIQMIGIVPEKLGDQEEEVKKKLSEQLHITVEDIDKKLSATWVKPELFVPIRAIASEEKGKLEELTQLSGVTNQRQSARVYPLKEKAAHLVGYIGNINQEELEKLKDEEYNSNSIIGKSGLESLYEKQLRAIDGKKINIVGEDNKIKETLAQKEHKDGQDLQLTIDVSLQESIYGEMQGEVGTAVAMHPKTGEVLALVNSPSYDPNAFILGLSSEQWENWNEDPAKPLLNRFTHTYTPGSVFKPITAAIALEEKAIDPNEKVNISGLQWRKNSSWGDYYISRVKDPGKAVNLRDAFVYSDNIYFAQAALNTGKKAFIEGTKKFGIGEKIPFTYSINSSQLAKDESLGKGDVQLADSGYGQGEVSMSPLHLSMVYTTFINDGNILQPTLNKKDTLENTKPWKEGIISKETAQRIKDDLVEVIENPEGTGNPAKIPGTTLGGKTGTAELKGSKEEKGQELGWFVAFNHDEPEILVTMMIEQVENKGGSAYVVPKVKKVIENYGQ